MKRRIVEVDENGKIHYEIEEKKFLFWKRVNCESYSKLFRLSYYCEFNTFEEAEEYLKNHFFKPIKKVIKTYN